MRELLRLVADGPSRSVRELAEALRAKGLRVEGLGADTKLVEIAIAELEHKGYLRREPQVPCPPAGADGHQRTGSGCAACPLQCGGRAAASWVLTDKGRGRSRRPIPTRPGHAR